MKCAHCLTEFHDEPTDTPILRGTKDLKEKTGIQWKARARVCPACGQAIIDLLAYRVVAMAGGGGAETRSVVHPAWPKSIARAPLPKEVVDPYANDYREACNVLADSPKASAALSRRSLQHLLREKSGVKKGNLYDEIEDVVSSKALPSDLADALHHVRVIGNFAAHAEKAVNTGAIVDVEPGEAEWTLDVLESLFDFYFVRPAKLAERKAALDKKLAEAGKAPLK